MEDTEALPLITAKKTLSSLKLFPSAYGCIRAVPAGILVVGPGKRHFGIEKLLQGGLQVFLQLIFHSR
jgi:hypothetical protein